MAKLTASAVAKMRAGKGRRREIPDHGCPGLYLVIQQSGKKSWALRFRRPGDHRPAKLVLGSVHAKNVKDKSPDPDPIVGGHLTLAAAHRLAANLRHQIKQGLDPAAAHIEEKKRARAAVAEAAENGTRFDAAARAFIEGHKVKKTGERPRHWREVASILGLSYPVEADDPTKVEPNKIEGGLADRWCEKHAGEITSEDVQAIVDESTREGIPGLNARNEDVSNARGRKMADALGAMFKWLMRNRRKAMKANPCRDIYRPDGPVPRDRVLNCKPDVRRADELRWFWRSCDSLSEPFGALLKLLLLTGCRLREIAELRWDELNDDRSMLHLPGARTKNSLPHDVGRLMDELNGSTLQFVSGLHRPSLGTGGGPISQEGVRAPPLSSIS